jgi:hypothetical protein
VLLACPPVNVIFVVLAWPLNDIIFLFTSVACTINIYDCKFYDRKLHLSLERNYDRMIVILAKASLNYDHSLQS